MKNLRTFFLKLDFILSMNDKLSKSKLYKKYFKTKSSKNENIKMNDLNNSEEIVKTNTENNINEI